MLPPFDHTSAGALPLRNIAQSLRDVGRGMHRLAIDFHDIVAAADPRVVSGASRHHIIHLAMKVGALTRAILLQFLARVLVQIAETQPPAPFPVMLTARNFAAVRAVQSPSVTATLAGFSSRITSR